MNTSRKRKDGGAYRRYQTMMAIHCKEGKDRAKSRTSKRKK